jgi:Rod binding domain-containing protein
MIFFDKDVYDDNVSIHPNAETRNALGYTSTLIKQLERGSKKNSRNGKGATNTINVLRTVTPEK